MNAAALIRAGGRTAPAALLLALVACGDKTTPNPFQTAEPGDGSALPDGFTFGDSGGSSPTSNDPSVMITIVTPTAEAILVSTATVDVRATVAVAAGSNASAIIDPQSVRATVVAITSGSAMVDALSPVPLVVMAVGDFRGKLSLTNLPSGDYGLRVDAATTAGAKASAQIAIHVDGGPTITVLSPTVNGHYKGILSIEAVIDSTPYAPTTAPIDATVGGVPVSLTAVGTSTTFRGTIDFHQPNPPLTGPQLLIIAAKNARGTRSESRTTFVVDESGPTITNTTPAPGDVVGGVIKIKASIEDDAGVLPSSVIVLIGNDTDTKFELPLAEEGNGFYSILFDTAKLTACDLGAPQTGLCMVFPTLSFRAADLLGNETTVAYEIGIDNRPPLLDLDPPTVRDSKLDMGLRCSWPFDPLGNNALIGDMPADGCTVSQVFDLRARVEDTGNVAGGLKKAPLAGLNPDTVAVYILDDTSQALTVDSNGDGICDAINPTLVPTTSPPTQNNQVLKVRLSPVKPAGGADYTADPSLPGALACGQGLATDPPLPLCTVSQPTIVISYAGGESAIWSVDPINAAYCEGGAFDTFANNIGEGWACIAVAATDNNGNTGVSAPLRVWVSYNQDGAHCPAPPPSASAPPDCTGRFDQAAGTVTATPCASRRFAPGEICFQGDCH
ncbi:MAG TPA: Ig-like domain-containing protein [Polyangia bacterium]|nr:Ig-like domain-containing protein [Polyangia bacterium]